jgi:tripartite-type tricarboxylate transporter receptor subunit TctC
MKFLEDFCLTERPHYRKVNHVNFSSAIAAALIESEGCDNQSRAWRKQMMLKSVFSGLALAAVIASATTASAAEWPERPVTIVVNYGAGGGVDITARALGKAVESTLGVPVIVENRVGAQGTTGVGYVATAPADGNTIAVVPTGALAIAPYMVDTRYKIEDFDYLGAFGRFRSGIVVSSDSPVKTVDDLVALAKKKTVVYGAGSAPNNLPLSFLGKKTGAKFKWIPYPSAAESVTALLGGQVDAIVQGPESVMEFIKAGKLRLVASTSPVRWHELPETPSLVDLGYDISVDAWFGLAVPKGVPQDRVEKLSNAFADAMRTDEVKQRLVGLFMLPEAMSGPDYKAFLDKQYAFMGPVLREAGLSKK